MAFILIIFIILGSIGAVVILSKKNLSSSMTHTNQIVNRTTNVSAGKYDYYMFIIPLNSSNIHVLGTFTVQGGNSTGITVYIFDSTNFDNYMNGDYFGALYQSSQTTAS